MNDPEMTFRIDPEAGTLEPLTYQQDGWPGIYQEVYPAPGRWIPKLSRDLSAFTEQWLKNIEQQSYRKERAVTQRNGEDISLQFDSTGEPLPEEPPAPAAKSPVTLYRETLALVENAVKQSALYSYLRDRDTDIDSAKDELDTAISDYMEDIAQEHPDLADAYLGLPMFREWLTEDILERYYQDAVLDGRDMVEKSAGDPDTPDWAREAQEVPAADSLEAPTGRTGDTVPPRQEPAPEDTGAGASQTQESAQQPQGFTAAAQNNLQVTVTEAEFSVLQLLSKHPLCGKLHRRPVLRRSQHLPDLRQAPQPFQRKPLRLF